MLASCLGGIKREISENSPPKRKLMTLCSDILFPEKPKTKASKRRHKTLDPGDEALGIWNSGEASQRIQRQLQLDTVIAIFGDLRKRSSDPEKCRQEA